MTITWGIYTLMITSLLVFGGLVFCALLKKSEISTELSHGKTRFKLRASGHAGAELKKSDTRGKLTS